MIEESKKDSIDSRKEILDFLKDLQAHYAAYHNHKEAMGWAGIVLFSGWMFGFATLFREYLSQHDLSCGGRAMLSLVVMAACLVCWFYVQKQFSLRKRAADLVAACICQRSQFVSDLSKVINTTEWAPPIDTDPGDFQSASVLPQALLTSANRLSRVGHRSLILLERSAYAILFGLSAVLLARIWIAD